MDVHEPHIRSYNMSRIRGKDTKPEILVRKFIYGQGFRYRLHAKNLPGKPDIVFRKLKKAIFVHGCFWHGHEGCRYFVIPKTRTSWWLKKINGNKDRDSANLKLLKRQGWRVMLVFECDLKTYQKEATFKRLLRFLRQ
jgi:DNA mismatch endonuclease (patch repair protein)